MKKPKAIIFDLDWTLCELWDSANPYNHDGEELEIESMTHIYKHLHYLGWDIRVIMTWRKKKDFWEVTREWLMNNNFLYDRLIMQEGSTAEKNHIFKSKELRKLQKQYEIIAMFDDNPDLIPVCKELWIPLLHVNI